MNLPMDAVEFCDVFIGLFKGANLERWRQPDGEVKLPLVHVYGFTHEDDLKKAKIFFVKRLKKAMDFPEFTGEMIECFHQIRDVSPTSRMYSITFRLPKEVALLEQGKLGVKQLEEESKKD